LSGARWRLATRTGAFVLPLALLPGANANESKPAAVKPAPVEEAGDELLEEVRARRGTRRARCARWREMIDARSMVLALLLVVAVPAFAQQAPGQDPTGTEWSSLSSGQQRLLERYREGWAQLPPERQRALARGSERWLSMSPEQRSSAKERFERWRDLPPEDRRQLRDRWEKFRALPPEQQEHVRDNFRRFRNIPPERRRELRERWENATPDERERMLDRLRQQREQRPPREHRQRPERRDR